MGAPLQIHFEFDGERGSFFEKLCSNLETFLAFLRII